MRQKKSKFTIEFGFGAGKPLGSWRDIPVPVVNDDAVKTLRPDQELACKMLRGALRWVLNQPTASGKTLITMALCWLYLKVNPTHLVIIAVPQTQIAEGFKNCKFTPFGERKAIQWVPANYLIGGDQPEKTRRLLSLLKGKRHPDPMERAVVCTHLTLLLAVRKAFKESPKLFRDLLLVVDEAHHCRVDPDVGDPELAGLLPDRTNALGRLIELAITEPKRNLSVGLVTATFFRGDFSGIVGEHRASFVDHKMTYADFFEICAYLRNLIYNYALYENDWSGVVDKAWQDNPQAHMIVYIPYVQSECSHPDGKVQDVQAVWRGVSSQQNPQVKQDGPCVLVRRGDRWLRFVNLVDPVDREIKKQYIERAHQGEVGLDGIVCLGMFKEGSNWQQADTAVIIGPRSSLTEVVQMIGRLLRDFPGKPTVTVYHCLPEDQENQGEQYRVGRIKAIMAAMVLEELYCPTKVVGRKGGTRGPRAPHCLLDLAGDDLGVVAGIKQDIIEQMVLRNNPDVLYPKDLLKTVVAEVLKARLDIDDPADIQAVAEQTRRSLVKRHHDKARLELLTNTDDVDAELFHQGLLSFGIDAAGLRRWHAILLDRRENWFARFWSHLLEYLFGQYDYQLRGGLDTLGNHPPEEPVVLTCPHGHEYSVAPQDFACGDRCPD